jgi:hypothetical protein
VNPQRLAHGRDRVMADQDGRRERRRGDEGGQRAPSKRARKRHPSRHGRGEHGQAADDEESRGPVQQGGRDPAREARGQRPGRAPRARLGAEGPREGQGGQRDGQREGLVELGQDQHRAGQQRPEDAETRGRERPASDGAGQTRHRPGGQHAGAGSGPQDARRPRVGGVLGRARAG